MPVPSDPRWISNRILSALPLEDYRRLTDQAEEVSLAVGDRLYHPRQPIPHIYFINSGIGSVMTTMEDGTSIEVMVVGREGMMGLHGLDSDTSTVPTEAFMQIAGQGIRIGSAAVRREFSRGAMLQCMLLRYMQFALLQIGQSAACNRLHDLEERLSCWLLMIQDRVQSNEFILTHDFLAQKLGTRRSSVTLAAGTLHRAGLLNYHRGRIHILDREGLEEVSCECYSIIKESFDLLLKTK